ncbi:hypothetical protein PoB_004642800 [Plakobranchus ocellatus]|uniref:Uncharacterized protein n=1 Tax=Plakobranchus ocellatus TaxID=259542 RepID=A0AAV4BL84_9GAST|nr:hypothetical protein PoB_004642800 [Plakobranchus ocellatus]
MREPNLGTGGWAEKLHAEPAPLETAAACLRPKPDCSWRLGAGAGVNPSQLNKPTLPSCLALHDPPSASFQLPAPARDSAAVWLQPKGYDLSAGSWNSDLNLVVR